MKGLTNFPEENQTNIKMNYSFFKNQNLGFEKLTAIFDRRGLNGRNEQNNHKNKLHNEPKLK